MSPEQVKEVIEEYLMQCNLDVTVYTYYFDDTIQVSVALCSPEGNVLLVAKDSCTIK